MTYHSSIRICSVAIALICAASSFAQGKAAKSKAANAAAAPAAKTPSKETPTIGPPLETNPAVQAALELPRKTPADYFQAITWLIELGRPELAKPILDELTKMPLTDAQRAELVEQVGAHAMLKLARTFDLSPGGAKFADACMAAANAAATDPQRIAGLIKQLTDESPEVRTTAINDLGAIGQPGVNAALEALARASSPQDRQLIATAAAQMSPLADGPLLAMLSSPDGALRSEVANLLEHLQVSQAAPFLAPDSVSAESALDNEIARYTAGSRPFASDANDNVTLWYWNDATRKLSSRIYTADEAQAVWLGRLALTLAQIRPDDRSYARAALVFGLEAMGLNLPAQTAGQSPAMQQFAGAADSLILDRALADALAAKYHYAAAALADALGKRGDVGVLYTDDGKPSPLAEAINSPSRRVRFAALRAIMLLNPESPWPGSSRVPDMLTWFAHSTGDRQAVVAMPTNVMSTDLAGKLAAHNLEGAATDRGRDAVNLALSMPDLEMILVDMDILSPDIRQVLYELRISPVTGDTPIAILAADGRFDAAENLAAEHTGVIAVSRPHAPEVLQKIVEALNAHAPRDGVPAAERAAQAAQARQWLNQLRSKRTLYTIRSASAADTVTFQPGATPAAPAAP